MNYNPKINLNAFEASFKAIDTHTVGEFTRIIMYGFTELKGDSMIERKQYIENNFDK